MRDIQYEKYDGNRNNNGFENLDGVMTVCIPQKGQFEG
jgi:hypothetical protein